MQVHGLFIILGIDFLPFLSTPIVGQSVCCIIKLISKQFNSIKTRNARLFVFRETVTAFESRAFIFFSKSEVR